MSLAQFRNFRNTATEATGGFEMAAVAARPSVELTPLRGYGRVFRISKTFPTREATSVPSPGDA